MSGETGQLQRLTDEQVSARLAAYNGDGSLDRDVAFLREKAGDLIETHVRDHFGQDAAERVKTHYSSKVDSGWIQAVAEYGRRIFQEKNSVPAYIAARDRLKSAILADMFDRFAEDKGTLETCANAFQRLTTIETDIILAQVALLEAIEARERVPAIPKNVAIRRGGIAQQRGTAKARGMAEKLRPCAFAVVVTLEFGDAVGLRNESPDDVDQRIPIRPRTESISLGAS